MVVQCRRCSSCVNSRRVNIIALICIEESDVCAAELPSLQTRKPICALNSAQTGFDGWLPPRKTNRLFGERGVICELLCFCRCPTADTLRSYKEQWVSHVDGGRLM